MFAWLSVAAGLAGCQREPTPVVILTIDTLRPDHLSTYGYGRETDPGIASVAADGVVFTRAFTTVPKTPPAFASMFTCLYPHRHGLRMLGQELAFLRVITHVLICPGQQRQIKILHSVQLGSNLTFLRLNVN